MKVAVQCNSPLLQRSLELFLDEYLSSLKQCDIVVRDKRIENDPHLTLLIGASSDADLVKPFSRSQLMLVLEQMVKKDEVLQEVAASADEPEDEKMRMDFSVLEKRIEKLTQEYQQNVIKAVRAFYER